MSNNIENLFTQYYQILRAYALRYVQNQDAAEDIVQDVFFELWLRRNEIDFDLPMKAYLFKSVLMLIPSCKAMSLFFKLRERLMMNIRWHCSGRDSTKK